MSYFLTENISLWKRCERNSLIKEKEYYHFKSLKLLESYKSEKFRKKENWKIDVKIKNLIKNGNPIQMDISATKPDIKLLKLTPHISKWVEYLPVFLGAKSKTQL